MGRTVGVIHATSEPNISLAEAAVQDLETLAKPIILDSEHPQVSQNGVGKPLSIAPVSGSA